MTSSVTEGRSDVPAQVQTAASPALRRKWRMPRFEFSRIQWTLVGAALLLLVAVADYASPAGLRFSVFYYIPIALLAWTAGRDLAFAAAVMAAVVWWVVEVSTAQSYTTPLLAGGNYALRLVAFVVVAVTIARLRAARDREQQLKGELQSTIAKLEISMSEMNELRDKMQLVCAWTNRIKSEGHWIPIDRFLADKLHLKISHGISEEAVERFLEAGAENEERSGRHGGAAADDREPTHA